MLKLISGTTGYGTAAGKAFVVNRNEDKGMSVICSADDFRKAFDEVASELERQAADNDIFAAHLEMMQDPMLEEAVTGHIGNGYDAVKAVEMAGEEISAMLEAVDDEYIRSRSDDVKDICGRIIRKMSGTEKNPFSAMTEGCIIVAEELTPSDTAQMDFSKINGIVTGKGSRTSHVCIIAQSHGTAVLTGVDGVVANVHDGDLILIDGPSGEIIINPDESDVEHFKDSSTKIQKYSRTTSRADSDNIPEVLCNAGSIEEIKAAMAAGADGIGLFRSEFLFMGKRDGWPDEETQYKSYSAAAEICGSKPLVIRTLDIGGDKPLDYCSVEHEDNPFLGMRGIRFSLKHKEIFKTQLRAILKASASGNVSIMLPMVSDIDELNRAMEILEECKHQLEIEGVAFNSGIPVGIMIETPAAVFTADDLAEKASFFSIGTNDLAQYVMAADRGNPSVSSLCDTRRPAVRAALKAAIEAGHRHGIKVGMCGAMASDPAETATLKKWGLDSFSVVPPVLDEIKDKLATS